VVLLSAETEDDAVVRALETADAISTAVVCELGGTVSIGVGDPPEDGEFRDPGGRGKFYVDQIRLMAGE